MGTIQLNISKKYDSMTVKEYTEELKKLSDQNSLASAALHLPSSPGRRQGALGEV